MDNVLTMLVSILFILIFLILAVVLIIFGFFFVKPDEDFILTVSKNKKETVE